MFIGYASAGPMFSFITASFLHLRAAPIEVKCHVPDDMTVYIVQCQAEILKTLPTKAALRLYAAPYKVAW